MATDDSRNSTCSLPSPAQDLDQDHDSTSELASESIDGPLHWTIGQRGKPLYSMHAADPYSQRLYSPCDIFTNILWDSDNADYDCILICWIIGDDLLLCDHHTQ